MQEADGYLGTAAGAGRPLMTSAAGESSSWIHTPPYGTYDVPYLSLDLPDLSLCPSPRHVIHHLTSEQPWSVYLSLLLVTLHIPPLFSFFSWEVQNLAGEGGGASLVLISSC